MFTLPIETSSVLRELHAIPDTPPAWTLTHLRSLQRSRTHCRARSTSYDAKMSLLNDGDLGHVVQRAAHCTARECAH